MEEPEGEWEGDAAGRQGNESTYDCYPQPSASVSVDDAIRRI
jgi:hypothetical protein